MLYWTRSPKASESVRFRGVPRMQMVSEGVYQLEIPMRFNPLGCTHSYLLRDASALIDTGVGTNEAFEALEKQLGSVGLATSDIEYIVLTHLHRDHVGLVEKVRSASGAVVHAHRSAVELQRKEEGAETGGSSSRADELRLLGGGRYISMLGRFEGAVRRPRPTVDIDETHDDGDTIDLNGSDLKVLWTPGHSPEHICLYDAEKSLLYSGDHILPRITSHISLHPHEGGDPLRNYLDSLERLRGLQVNAVLPAHEQIFHDLEGRISELELHHLIRCDEVKAALGEGEKTVFQVASAVSWDSQPWPRMRFWTKRMAAAETLAHLVYLRNRGEVGEELRKGVLYYGLK
jgi:glyoxylase-like metal-dependent hydrolase (beta-lactamase superfamily II)